MCRDRCGVRTNRPHCNYNLTKKKKRKKNGQVELKRKAISVSKRAAGRSSPPRRRINTVREIIARHPLRAVIILLLFLPEDVCAVPAV